MQKNTDTHTHPHTHTGTGDQATLSPCLRTQRRREEAESREERLTGRQGESQIERRRERERKGYDIWKEKRGAAASVVVVVLQEQRLSGREAGGGRKRRGA